MKRCPQCAADYYDDMLEFCLEDGAKLFAVTRIEDDAATVTRPNKPDPFTEQTLNLPFAANVNTVESKNKNAVPVTFQNHLPIKKEDLENSKILGLLPVIFALAHNWWQWIYIGNQYISSIPSFLISGNFIIWLLLLTAGAAVSLISVKRNSNKGFAIISLVILSINLILFLVPRR